MATAENGVYTEYTFDRGSIIADYDQVELRKTRYIRGHALISQKDKEGTKSYYLHNAHGDVTKLVDSTGNVQNSYSYDAFGNTTTYTERVKNMFRYAGEQYDTVMGLYYLRARYYQPQVGRFTQEDSYLDDGLNLYTYVANNPVIYVDPTGHWLHIAIGAGIGALVSIGARAVSDVIRGKASSWDAYVSDAVGGAVGGAVFAGTRSIVGASLASAATTNVLQKGFEYVKRKDTPSLDDVVKVAKNTVVDTLYGIALGKVGQKVASIVPKVNIPSRQVIRQTLRKAGNEYGSSAVYAVKQSITKINKIIDESCGKIVDFIGGTAKNVLSSKC